MNHNILVVIVIVLLTGASSALGQMPETLAYQGYLTDAAGIPVSDPSVTLTLRLYDSAAGGSSSFTETHEDVLITEGVFSVQLGSEKELARLSFEGPLYLSVAVGDEAAEELSPRIALSAVPYSMRARTLDDDALLAGDNVSIEREGQALKISTSGGSGSTLSAPDGNPLTAVSVDNNGLVGIGTGSPKEHLHVLDRSAGSAVFLGGDGTLGPHGIVFDDDTPGNGVQLFWRTNPNMLVLERSSGGSATNGSDAFSYDRDDDHFSFHGSVGIGGTESTRENLHVHDPEGGSAVFLGNDGTPGPNGLIFEDDEEGEGVQLLWRTSPDRLVLERTSRGTSVDGDDAFYYDRSRNAFHFDGSISWAPTTSYMMLFPEIERNASIEVSEEGVYMTRTRVNEGSFYRNVRLPHGAIIEAMSVFYRYAPDADTDFQLRMLRSDLETADLEILDQVRSLVGRTEMTIRFPVPLGLVVDNSRYVYFAELAYPENASRDHNIYGIRIKYTVSAPY